MIKAVIGIDPGTSGTAWLLDENRRWSYIEFAKQKWWGIQGDIKKWSYRYNVVKVFRENVHNLPGDRGDVAWKFAMSVGRIDQIIEWEFDAPLDYELVDPRTWQAALGLAGNSHIKPGMTDQQQRAARKKRHLERAEKLILGDKHIIPNTSQEYLPYFTPRLTQSNCDGLLITEYGWRKTFTPEKLNDELDPSIIMPGTGVINTVRKKR